MYPKIGKPIIDTINYVKTIKKQGNKIILWTCREGEYLKEAVDWCMKQGLEFDAINNNLEEISNLYKNNSRKIAADYYIDDKALKLETIKLKDLEVNEIRIEIRNNSVLLDGYVNATGKDSKLLPSIKGKFKEQIVPQAFTRSLEKTDNVDLLLNHDKSRKLGSTKEGNLELFEDGIGLRAICTVTDSEVIDKAKKGQLRGWSFGFYSEKDRWEDTTEGFQRRYVDELELFEVSIVDNTKTPAYVGTSIEMRAEEEVLTETRTNDSKTVTVDNSTIEKRSETINNSRFKNELEYFKLKSYK